MDTLKGTAGSDSIDGLAGDDRLQGDGGADLLNGGEGFDTAVFSDASNLNLKTNQHTGHAEGDTFIGIERFEGSTSPNTFVSDARPATFNGGGGIDTMDYSTSPEAVSVSLNAKGSITSGGDSEGHQLISIENVIGSAFADTLATELPNSALQGGLGNDIYIAAGLANSTTKFVEEADGGDDEVRTALPNWTLDPHIERLTYTGSANFIGTGTEQANTLTGGAGHDKLLGKGGPDQLMGGNGNDVLEGGADADVLNGGGDYDIASYLDSPEAITFNFETNVHSGFASGDTYIDVELIRGSNHADTFIPGQIPTSFDGGAGIDLADYSASTAAVAVDRSLTWTQGTSPVADVLTNVEVFKGTQYDDTFIGGNDAENFIGGAGKDSFNGGNGADGAWYVTNYQAVEIDLANNISKGGDADGDTFSSIENIIGTSFDDVITGDHLANQLEGGAGDDVIHGGAGDDFIYGGMVSSTAAVPISPGKEGHQADMLYGGEGNDTIRTHTADKGSVIYGEGGNDSLSVNSGVAHGGVGNDRLAAWGSDYEVHGNFGNDSFELHGRGDAHGGEGDDQFVMYNAGSVFGDEGNDVFQMIGVANAYGGEGSDTYIVESYAGGGIGDEGTTGHDTVKFLSIPTLDDLKVAKVGYNAFIHSQQNQGANIGDNAFILFDWFNGQQTIETFQVANGDSFSIEGMVS
ncbi:hypothetical protein [Pseudomonas sp. W2-17]|uniref:hypothetical protein n=1 Tax=Pseudomonas sp. W2-17 TaxID=3058039 RepID=UPI0034E08606